MTVCRSSMLNRFIHRVLRRRPSMLGLDHLIGATFSSQVATNPWYTSTGHGWYILGGHRGITPAKLTDIGENESNRPFQTVWTRTAHSAKS